MREIRLHGRGGQGVRLAAKILARMLFLSGFQTQDFAIYGAERRGAPVTSFVRSDKKQILERGYVFEPDIVAVLDDTLNFSSVTKGLKDGFVIVNSHRDSAYFSRKHDFHKKVYSIDATQAALRIIGKPIANAAIIGALARLMNLDIKKVEEAISIEFGEEGLDDVAGKNMEAAKKCYDAIK